MRERYQMTRIMYEINLPVNAWMCASASHLIKSYHSHDITVCT